MTETRIRKRKGAQSRGRKTYSIPWNKRRMMRKIEEHMVGQYQRNQVPSERESRGGELQNIRRIIKRKRMHMGEHRKKNGKEET